MALGDYNIIVHEKHALHITQVGIPCNSGGIISNLLLSRAYFPHLFHIISAKAQKKLQLLSENLQEVAAVGWAIDNIYPYILSMVGRTSAISH